MCLLCFVVVFLSGCNLYLLFGRAYMTPKAFGFYFKSPSSSFGLATPYSIWEHQNFPLNNGHSCSDTYSKAHLAFLLLFNLPPAFPILPQWIRVWVFHYLPLWHASGGPNCQLPLLGKMPS